MVLSQRPLQLPQNAETQANDTLTALKHHRPKHPRGTVPSPLADRLLVAGACATGFVLLCMILLWLFNIRPILARASRVLPRSLARPAGDVEAQGRQKRGDIIQIQTLDPKLLPVQGKHGKGRRLVIVGDVHGCRAELEALLHKINFIPAHDHLILAGDMINKGPDSHGVIALARSLDASAVRGNHEDKVLRAYASLDRSSRPSSGPRKSNAVETLARELSDEDVQWLAQCPLILSIGRIPGLPFANTVVVHAGLMPNVPLEEQDSYDVMNMRSIVEKTMKASERSDVGTRWWKVWNNAQERVSKGKRIMVVYGHHAKEGLVEADYSIGLDSGCVRGGMLNALVIGGVDKHGRPRMKVASVNHGAHI